MRNLQALLKCLSPPATWYHNGLVDLRPSHTKKNVSRCQDWNPVVPAFFRSFLTCHSFSFINPKTSKTFFRGNKHQFDLHINVFFTISKLLGEQKPVNLLIRKCSNPDTELVGFQYGGFRSPSPRGWSWPRRNAKKTTMKFQIWRLSSRGLKSVGKGTL